MRREDLIKLDEEMLGAYMANDVDLVLSHCSDDVVFFDFGGPGPIKGKDAGRAYLAEQFAPFSNSKAKLLKRIIDGSELFAEIEWTTTNTGDIAMPDGTIIPATGKTMTVGVAYYSRVNEAGEVLELRSYPDMLAWMGQLGLMS